MSDKRPNKEILQKTWVYKIVFDGENQREYGFYYGENLEDVIEKISQEIDLIKIIRAEKLGTLRDAFDSLDNYLEENEQ